ncbi:VanZ family protein [Paenibacillus polysaccharolyticus]|uniref:VanZ family protein n=1 Tax=Paenibacillus polysaccharolyticus TaxID=582692 RepID=UPI00209EABF4|nr:VanZ family protein [Paenibacillus polysaccharolyticus]MCP1136595.1 VanZ family protein [Paenibacillus polysaccharolyticus]
MSIQFTISSFVVLVPLFILILLTLVIHARVSKARYTGKQYMLMLTFVIYMLGMMHFVFFPIDVNIGMYANQTPWYSNIQWVPLLTADAPSFLLNILLFMPLGFLLPLWRPSVNSIKKVAKTGLTVSLTIELLQLVIRIAVGNGRSTDINDLIANTSGSVLGFIVLSLLTRLIGQKLILPWKMPGHKSHSTQR